MSYSERTSSRRSRPIGGRLSSTEGRAAEGRRVSRTRSTARGESGRGRTVRNVARRDDRIHDGRAYGEGRRDGELRDRQVRMGSGASARDGRSTRRANRAPRKRTRSVGADVLSFPASRANGLNLRINRPYGRGSTAQLVQDQRDQTGVSSRPAVYTKENVGLRDRVRIARRWGTGLHLNMWYVVLATVVAIALVAAAIMGPLRDYYTAWREAGRLDVEYEVVSGINETLADDVERLNTLEGIEDEARRRGYVYPDEEAVVVEGLDDEEPAEEEEVKVALDEYERGLPWYVHVLDGLLGYRKG